MQLIQNILSFNQILTVSLLGWFVAQVLKTIINFVLLGRFQLERMWGDGGMPSAHSATVTAMVIATARSEGIHSAIFAVAAVVAIITMHDAMGVRHETGEQAKVLNQMIAQWIDVSEKNAPFLQNMHLKEMVGHTPLQVVAGVLLGSLVGAVLQAAAERRVIVVDGFITSAAVLVASRIAPQVLQRCVFAHRSGERGHALMLKQMQAEPLLDLGLRLGEGSGAALAWPLLQSACAVLREMASFESAGVATQTA